ncbi:uncharacterized protein [Ptychodera flava]|uniref:uncharacterized protein n=1 Tax=Ptychodera flava TaxID=63121 RepID=UPI00396A805B
MWPQHHRYKTHVSKFEMFPRIDPERTEFDAPVIPQSRTKQELSEATNIAIERMTQTRYRNSLYDQTFVDFTKEAPAERNSVLTDSNNLSSTVESESGTECEDGAGNKDDEEQKSEDDDKSERDESEETVSMETKVPESFQTKKLEGEGCQATACPLHGRQHPIKSEKPINVNTRTDIATVISDTIVKMDSMAKSKLAGLAPCWPPSASYTIGKDSQLVERNTVDMYPAAYTSSLKPKNCTCQTYVANSLKKSESTTALVQHKPDIKIELPPVLKNKRPVAPFMLLPCVGDGAVQKVEWIKLPPEPLSSCLQPTGSRVPDRIGLRFRTEAHQRYHLTHPEPVPDLRALKTTHKKYFFYGYHASVFRG